MGRISRAVMFMGIARLASQRSTCMRLNVGAVITHDNRPVSIGWNGAAPGAAHCAGNECPGVVPGRCGTTHAERNAISHLPMSLVGYCPNGGLDLYCTDSPCEDCARLIIDSQVIGRVFFERAYRDPSPLKLLWEKKVPVFEVTPAGYIVDYFSRQVVEHP